MILTGIARREDVKPASRLDGLGQLITGACPRVFGSPVEVSKEPTRHLNISRKGRYGSTRFQHIVRSEKRLRIWTTLGASILPHENEAVTVRRYITTVTVCFPTYRRSTRHSNPQFRSPPLLRTKRSCIASWMATEPHEGQIFLNACVLVVDV